jgi:ABC-2 type transport system permease protein
MNLLRLVRWEVFKLARQRSSYAGFVICLLYVVVVMIGFGFAKWRHLNSYKGLLFNPMDYINGPFFAHYALQIGFIAILPLAAATIGGSQIAGEARDGTLRVMLVRPPSRAALFFAKTIATWLWLQLMIFFVVALSLLVGMIAYGDGQLLVFIWEFRASGPWLVDSPDWWLLLLTVSLAAGAALFVLAAMSLMLTTMTESPVIAHVGTLGAYLISSVIHRLPKELVADEVREAVPTAHMSWWQEVYKFWDPATGTVDADKFWVDIAWCGGFTAVFLGVGLWWLSRKDITS